MSRWIAVAAVFSATLAMAQNESRLASDFRREGEHLKENCAAFKTFASCAQTLFTEAPLHITAGSIAPQNGVAFGPAFVFDYNTHSWRWNFNMDAVVSTKGSWRSGAYLKLAKTTNRPSTPVVLTTRPTHPVKAAPPPPSPEINIYAQAISLDTIPFYGVGNSTSRLAETLFGMREVIAGVSGMLPLGHTGLGVFGELNGRFVEIRPSTGGPPPSIGVLYSNFSAPGLATQPGFLQTGEGLRFGRSFAAHLALNYSATFQQFTAPSDSTYSFRRLNLDFTHVVPFYSRTRASRPPFGPDGSSEARPDYYVNNRQGSIEFGTTMVLSFQPADHTVPFYFQPTLGGSDINGDRSLPSYPDYRFRAPNLLLFHAVVEHSVWGPFGLEFLTHYGRVAAARGDLALEHLRHSFAAGLTIRAGGLPEVALLFAWGGGEGTHTIAYISPGLLGGSGRPSLF